jgi:hypothetical protein
LPPRDPADVISGFCTEGKHGKCTGWLVVPSYGDLHDDPDISTHCRCPVCKHPRVDPKRHLTHPPTKAAAWNKS